MIRFHYAATSDADMRHCLLYTLSDPVFYLEVEGREMVFLNGLELEAFRESGKDSVQALPLTEFNTAGGVANTALAILNKFAQGEQISVPTQFPVGLADSLRSNGIKLVIDKEWGKRRWQKSPPEISAIAANMQAVTGAFLLVEQILKSSVIENSLIIYDKTELSAERLKRLVAQYFLEHNLTSPAGMIIASGSQSALPHHQGAGPLLANLPIVVDLFPHSQINHYWADMTRTYVKGTPTDQIAAMFTAVKEAHEAALKFLKPGVKASEVYEISAAVIKAAGFEVGETGYTHSLGHGLGVDIHEYPTLGPKSVAVLEEGMVVTIEPGLYYEADGGVRLEDTVVITKDGYQNLTNHPKVLIV